MPRSEKSLRQIYRETRLRQRPADAYVTAMREPVPMGSYTPQQLRRWGVGVPLLWLPAAVRFGPQTPQGLRTFVAASDPPGSILWAAAATPTQIVTSLHIDFVGEIARVCEAVDIQPDGRGLRYGLTLEPIDHAIGRALDVCGFGADGVAVEVNRTDLRAVIPWRWTPDEHGQLRAHTVPDDERHDLVLHMDCAADSAPRVAEHRRDGADTVPVLSGVPTRADVQAALHAFFAASPTTDGS
ncbi:hypothetical protein [uncultured Jatrophihabitans sp.]|uniref:hypothetical protein n=1 Tax=uncultured Jatrophihabitans sp. TaxID=1610747 RepID=UPI0035C9C698